MSILVTGGAGYIGSHTCIELLNAGLDIVVLDNLFNSKEECVERVKKISGKKFPFYICDVLDKDGLRKIFKENNIEMVIHFAGLKAVGESVKIPLKYYENNISGTLNLCNVMEEFGVKNIVFSSSATVYGDKNPVPFHEEMPIGGCTNPYGLTKFMIELILKDIYVSDKEWNICILRYFNPIGAHESGMIGEAPHGLPNNLMPFITQVAVGKVDQLNVYGNDYNTPDGTGVRDYIHVVDLAVGHLKATQVLSEKQGLKIYNLGSGKGTSVLDLLNAFEKVSGKKIPYKIAPRRAGDIDQCFASVDKAYNELGFKTTFDVERMCADSWRWQSNNPNGM